MNNIKVIGVAGKCQSGKDSLYEYLRDKIGYEVDQISFASPLKNLAINYLGLDKDLCYGTDDDKNTPTHLINPETKEKLTIRQALQYLGTDVLRGMHESIWVDLALKRIDDHLDPTSPNNTMTGASSLVMLTDVRFPDEKVALDKRDDAIVIKVERSNYPRENEHSSETALDHLKDSDYDFVIRASNLEELYEKGDELLIHLKAINRQ